MSNDEKTTKKSHLSFIIRIAIAVVVCWIIYQKIDLTEVAEKFKPIHIWMRVLLASAVFSGGVCMVGLRWWVFMRAQEIHVPLFLAIKLTFLGQFFTNFMPSSVGGDLVRAWYVSRHTHKRLQAVLGVAIDRVVGLISTLVLAIAGYWIFMRGQGIFQVNWKGPGPVAAFFTKHPVSVYQIVLSVVVLAGIVLILTGFFDLRRFIKKLYDYVVHLLVQLKEVTMVYYHHPLVLVFGLLITFFLQSMVILSYWLVGRDLGMTDEIQFYFVFFPLIWAISSIPVSIAGLGILEGGVVFLFVQFTGARPEAAMALALCQRLTWIAASIPGLLVHLSGSHRDKEQSC